MNLQCYDYIVKVVVPTCMAIFIFWSISGCNRSSGSSSPIIVHARFENGLGGWHATECQATIVQDGRNGTQCLKVVPEKQDEWGAGVSKLFDLSYPPPQKILITCWIKGIDGESTRGRRVGITVGNGDSWDSTAGVLDNLSIESIGVKGDWEELKTTVKLPPGARTILLYVGEATSGRGLRGGNNQPFLLDDVQIIEVR